MNSKRSLLHRLFLPSMIMLVAIISICAALSARAAEPSRAGYVVTPLVGNKEHYKAQMLDEKLINAWGIAIRPAGAGGHFWVTGKDVSFEYVGDVRNSPDEKLRALHVDNLTHITLPVGGDDKFATGVVFSDSKDGFVITQQIEGAEPVTAPAKFLFASDGGIISAWTERKKPDGTFNRAPMAQTVIDDSASGAQFFGLAISHDYKNIYAADFGAQPSIKAYDGAFRHKPMKFTNPFDINKNGKVDAGEYAPFNIQQLTTPRGEHRLFVTYAKTQACPKEAIAKKTCARGEIWAGEEDTRKPGQGRLVEFTEEGKLVAIWKDGGRLSAPWGMVFAPRNFGKLSGMLLVGSFGDGTITAYNPETRGYVDVVRDAKGKPIAIDKLWGLLFGNGESLGDKNALYFAAGPKDETEGLFGSIRPR